MKRAFYFLLLSLFFPLCSANAQNPYSYGGPPYLREVTMTEGETLQYNYPLNISIGARDGSESGLLVEGDTDVIKSTVDKFLVNFGSFSVPLIIKPKTSGCYWADLTMTDPRAQKSGMLGLLVHVRSKSPSITIVPNRSQWVFHSRPQEKDTINFILRNMCSSWSDAVMHPLLMRAPFYIDTHSFVLRAGDWDRGFAGGTSAKELYVYLMETSEGVYYDTLQFLFSSSIRDSIISIPVRAEVVSAGVSGHVDKSMVFRSLSVRLMGNDPRLIVQMNEAALLTLEIYNSLGQLEYPPQYLEASYEQSISLRNLGLASGVHYARFTTPQGETKSIKIPIKY